MHVLRKLLLKSRLKNIQQEEVATFPLFSSTMEREDNSSLAPQTQAAYSIACKNIAPFSQWTS